MNTKSTSQTPKGQFTNLQGLPVQMFVMDAGLEYRIDVPTETTRNLEDALWVTEYTVSIIYNPDRYGDDYLLSIMDEEGTIDETINNLDYSGLFEAIKGADGFINSLRQEQIELAELDKARVQPSKLTPAQQKVVEDLRTGQKISVRHGYVNIFNQTGKYTGRISHPTFEALKTKGVIVRDEDVYAWVSAEYYILAEAWR